MTTPDPASAKPQRDFDLVLVLGGGNALGAYEAGVYEALHEAGLEPDWIAGVSIGAINGALIAGSPIDRRVAALRDLWRPAPVGIGLDAALFPAAAEVARRTAAVTWTLGAGRPGLFGPLLSSLAPWTDNRPALFDTEQLAATLARTVDFDRLNDGTCRFTATAVDLATGEDVVFDTNAQRLAAQHIRASAALPVTFPPVEIDGRLMVDGGLSANLPLDPVLAAPPSRPTLIVAADLLPLAQPIPATLGEMASRMQDLAFAAQSRRTLARWAAAYAGRADVSIALLRLAYDDQSIEVAGKAFDFSAPTLAHRWASGLAAGREALSRLAAGTLRVGQPGLTISD
jgi:NTE family protein